MLPPTHEKPHPDHLSLNPQTWFKSAFSVSEIEGGKRLCPRIFSA
jgi:hypothetical protein